MAVRKLQVFIASRFEEFAPLRAQLRTQINGIKRPPAEAIDLNDNYPVSQPPLDRCYEAIDEAEIVVLLLGDTYGSEAADGKSFTHLEYERVLRQSKTILPFVIRPKNAALPRDQRMSKWLEEVYRHECASRLDDGETVESQCNEICKALLEYLWEAAARNPDLDANYDRFKDDWEDSPVRLSDLAKPLHAERRPNSLRSLASEHAAEAFDALTLELPHIALHHLRKIHDLVPLEVVPGYWLARTLVIAGGIGNYKNSRELALRYATVAERREKSFEVAAMACRIVAARASEELDEREPALKHALEAHERCPYHWLGKFELGRQYALDRKTPDALRYAEEAFWLRPACFYDLQVDSAYRGIGKAVREHIQKRVEREADNLLQLERSTNAFASTLDLPDLPPLGSHDRAHSPLQTLDLARTSARRTLGVLQRCATALADGVTSFTAGPFRQLVSATHHEIQSAIEKENTAIAGLKKDLSKHAAVKNEHHQKTRRSVEIGVIALLFLALFLAIAIERRLGTGPIGVGIALIVAVGLATWGYANSHHLRRMVADAAHRRLSDELRAASERLAVATDALDAYHQRVSTLCERLERFCRLVQVFENTARKRVAYAPGVTWYRRNATDLVRLGSRDLGEIKDATIDNDLLPSTLAALMSDPPPPAETFWFARRLTTPTGEVLSRTAAYFP